jgi:microsomal dipeptidase-like Zn-dependent dipeptidase
MPHPIIDLHCDLLSYLARFEGAEPNNTEEIGAAIPHLKAGNVKLQVMALYSGGDADYTEAMASWFGKLQTEYGDTFRAVKTVEDIDEVLAGDKVGMVAAIENASGLCNEDEPLDKAFERFERLDKEIGPFFYLSLTHHGENRFGGGNNEPAGLKDDGEALLDFLSGRKVAIDLSHTSDPLAYGIIEHIDQHGLDLPIIASHSNFRSVYDHPRNLPDDLARTVIRRGGLIGMNFLRAFLHPEFPEFLHKHIIHGISLGAEASLCFGADYFCTKALTDPSRVPFFFEEHENAAKYPQILRWLDSDLVPEYLQALASGNAARFLKRLWGG